MTLPQPPDAGTPVRGARVGASLPSNDRRSKAAPFISLLVHILLIALVIRLTAAVAAPDHSPLGDMIHDVVFGGGGGGGGQNGQQFEHAKTPPPPPTEVPPPPPVIPPPTPAIIPPKEVPQTIQPPAPASDAAASTAVAAGTGTGTGGGNGSGTGTGTGSGEGPGTGSGKGGGTGGGNGGFPPQPQRLILPPLDHTPKALRGVSVEVTFMISAEGYVTNVTVEPPIKDADFAKKFDAVMREYRFTPGKDANGKVIAAQTTITVTYGLK